MDRELRAHVNDVVVDARRCSLECNVSSIFFMSAAELFKTQEKLNRDCRSIQRV